MIDFSKYTLQELRAVSSVLSSLIDDIIEAGDHITMNALPFDYYRSVIYAEAAAIDQQALAAGEDPAAAGNPPGIKCRNIDRCGVCLAYCPLYEAAQAEPDMFGWVGDALDDLCAAGEVMGK